MADTLKFGPEWLRALSDGNSSTSTPPPSPGFTTKYKLADHRYGREEMLALFMASPTVPCDLLQHTSIVVEKAQDPLALLPLSEEEQRIISQSVNSSAVLRLMGRGAPPIRGGRGGAMDRGRARGRGRGDPYIQRNISFEDDGGAGFTRPQSSSRPEPWEEGSRRFDHQYAGRGYEEGPISPRREFSRSMSSDNWRDREQTGEENGGDGDWRRAGPREKWVSRGSSWRDQGPPRGPYDPDSARSNGYQKDRGYDRPMRHGQRGRNGESWEEDDVPEWSMPNADDLDEPGTFDASGQFVSTKGSDEGGALEQSDGGTKSSDTKDAGDTETAKQPEKKQEIVKDVSIKKVKEMAPPPGVEKRTLPAATAEKQTTSVGKGANTKMPPSSKKSAEKESTAKGSISSSVNSVQKVESVKKDTGSKASSKVGSAATAKGVNSVNKDKSIGAVKKENSAKQSSAKTSSEKAKAVKNLQPAVQSTEDEAYKDLEKAAENLVATMTEEDEDKHLNHPPSSSLATVQSTTDAENAMKWFYRDPQGDVQGPFTSAEMAEWFSAGYFTMNLLVKRGRDELFQQLGELIKLCGGVPFLSNPATPPTTTASTASALPADIPPAQQQPPPSAAQQEQMKLFQQMMIQQHLVQQQYLMRQMQVQQTVDRLQEQESFKSLPIQQQHQLAMQLIVKQQQQMLLQQRAQQGSPRTTPTESVGEASHPVFQRSVSQPAELTAKQIEEATAGWSDMNSIGAGAWSHPTSVWDLDPPPTSSSPSVIDMQKERVGRLKEDEDDQRKRQDELLRKQKEEILRKTEEMQRMKEEIERQKQQEMQRMDELRRKQEEEFRRQEEEQRRLQEERQKKEEEEYKLHQEELRKQEQEILRQQELIRQQQLQKADLIRQQDLKRQQKEQQEQLIREELQRKQQAQQEKEMVLERQRQAELQRRQEMQRQQEIQRQQEVQRQQQQEALRRLQQQQEQLNNIQLPPTAQWANQPSTNQGQASMSLVEIQQHEEMERQEKEELSRQLESQQRLHMQALQQQQQQKSWSNQMTTTSNGSAKSLLEIQEEQARQLKKQEDRKQKQQQQQPQRSRNLGAVSASVWGSATAAHWSTDTSRGTESSKNASNNPLGFWDDAIIASKKASPSNNKAVDNNFPTLAGQPGHRPVVSTQSCRNPKVSKSKKEEETLQRLFQASKPGDDFTKWCESTLKNMATSVDIPTFVAFLQEVESPYEVHDYVRSYLGETSSTQEFARQFLEMRIQYKNKGRPQTEDSIWGPPPVNNPRDSRAPPAVLNDEYQKAKGKGKKKKMQRLDGSILGFTVQANPNRINVGEIDIADAV